MKNPELFDETNRATYCPESNKLHLYVGRVPRAEYDALRAEGWTSTPKQSEAGQGEFAATWTPARRDTALSYAGIIEDEDAGPQERAADRAERFGGYLDKRLDEAGGHADTYDAGPSAHGYQSQARADRAATCHDRSGTRAVDAWEKAEYWQQRTAGVISHALYVCRPDVRMGRIKTLEAELRQIESRYTPAADASRIMQTSDDGSGAQVPFVWCGQGRGGYWVEESNLDALKRGAADWITHLTLRLAYENQMLEAQGGRLASVEIEAGGYIGGKLIVKVNKSSVTGRVTSVDLKGPKAQGWTYKDHNVTGTDYALYQFDTERMPMSAYTAPTDESRAELTTLKAERKAKAPVKTPCPLVNPTDEDAERLQSIWNEREHDGHKAAKSCTEFEPAKVVRLTQAQYSAHSKGSYASCDTRGLCRDARLRRRESNMYTASGAEYDKKCGPSVCMIRRTSGGKSRGWAFDSVIVLTDKPQKALPAAVWSLPKPAALAFALESEPVKLTGRDSRGLSYSVNA